MAFTQKTPMERTGFAKKPAKESKKRVRKCAVKSCRAEFEPRSMTHKACCQECAQEIVKQDNARKARKALLAFREKTGKSRHTCKLLKNLLMPSFVSGIKTYHVFVVGGL